MMTKRVRATRATSEFIAQEITDAVRTFFTPVVATYSWARRGRTESYIACFAALSVLAALSVQAQFPNRYDSIGAVNVQVAAKKQSFAPLMGTKTAPVAGVANDTWTTDAASISATARNLQTLQHSPIRFKIVRSEPLATWGGKGSDTRAALILLAVLAYSPHDLTKLDQRLQRLENSYGYSFKIRKVEVAKAPGAPSRQPRPTRGVADVHVSTAGDSVNENMALAIRSAALDQGSPIEIVDKSAIKSGPMSIAGDDESLRHYKRLTDLLLQRQEGGDSPGGSVIKTVEIRAVMTPVGPVNTAGNR